MVSIKILFEISKKKCLSFPNLSSKQHVMHKLVFLNCHKL